MRPPEGYDIKNIPEQIIEECSQWVKFNSIEGCKKAEVFINYTLASNLLKTESMDVGSVSYKKPKEVYKRKVVKDQLLVKKMSKTIEEREVDLEKEKRNYEKEQIFKKKKELKEKVKL